MTGIAQPIFRPIYQPIAQAIYAARIGGGPAPFDPASLYVGGIKGFLYDPSNLSLSFQDSAKTTPVTAPTQPMGYMGDLTGNNNNVTQITSGKRPIYNVVGGKGCVSFDGVSQFLTKASADFSGATQATIVVAFTQYTQGTTAGILMEMGIPTSKGFGAYQNNGVPSGGVGGGIGSSGNLLFNNSPGSSAQRTIVLSLLFDPSQPGNANKVRVRINGIEVAISTPASSGTVTASAFAVSDLFLACRTGTLNFSHIDFFAGGVVCRALTNTELSNLEAWCGSRAGVSVGLPYGNTPSAWSDTGVVTAMSGYQLTSAFAQAEYTTTAQNVQVNSFNNLFSAYPQYTELGVYVNGVYNQSVFPTAIGNSTNNIVLPAGSKTVSFVNALQSDPSGTIIGTFLNSLSSDQPMTQIFPSATSRVLLYGDSITVGGNSTVASRDGWAMLVRAAYYPTSLALEAWGYRTLYDDCNTGPLLSSFVAKLVAYSPSRIWLAIGTNDYGLNKWAAVSFGTAYASVLDAIHAALPSVQIFCQTPIPRVTETANGSGSTLGDYRAQIVTAQGTRTGFTTFVDGTAILTTADLDGTGVHPTTAGHAKYATYVRGVLGI